METNVNFNVLGTKKIKTLKDLERCLCQNRRELRENITDKEIKIIMDEWLESLDAETKNDLHIIFGLLAKKRIKEIEPTIIKSIQEQVNLVKMAEFPFKVTKYQRIKSENDVV